MKKKREAFTIVELLAVLVILGIIMAIILPILHLVVIMIIFLAIVQIINLIGLMVVGHLLEHLQKINLILLEESNKTHGIIYDIK